MVNDLNSEVANTPVAVKITVRIARNSIFRGPGYRSDETWDCSGEEEPFDYRFGNAVEETLRHHLDRLGFSITMISFFLDSRNTGLNGVLLLNAANDSLTKSRQYLEYIRILTIAEVRHVWEALAVKPEDVVVAAEIDDPFELVGFERGALRQSTNGNDSDADNPRSLIASVFTSPIVLAAAVTAIFAAVVAFSTSEVTKSLGEGRLHVDAVSALMANTESIDLTEVGILKLDALITLVEENEDLKVNVSGFKKLVKQARNDQLKTLDDQNKELSAKVALGEVDAQLQLNENIRKINEIRAQTRIEADSKEALARELAGLEKTREQESATWSNEKKALTSDLVKERKTLMETNTVLQEARDEIESLRRIHTDPGSLFIANRLNGTHWEFQGEFFTLGVDGELVVSSRAPSESNPRAKFTELSRTGSWVVESDIVTLSYANKNLRLKLNEDWPSELQVVNRKDKFQRVGE